MILESQHRVVPGSTIYCLTLRKIAIVLSCQKCVSIASYYAFDVAASVRYVFER